VFTLITSSCTATESRSARLSASWRSNLVTCIVVQKVRPAPEFVFLAQGNQGFLHQFSRKTGNPHFCAREDVGKRVSVLLDSDGNCREVQRMLVESISIRLTDDAACAAHGRREGLQRPTSFGRTTVVQHFHFLEVWFNSRKAAREKESKGSKAKDPRRFNRMSVEQAFAESSDSDEEEGDLSASPPQNASPLELLKHNVGWLYHFTTKAHRAFERSAQSNDKQSKEKWSELLVNVFQATPRGAAWTNIHEGTDSFQSIHIGIEKYAGQLIDMLKSTFPTSCGVDGCVGKSPAMQASLWSEFPPIQNALLGEFGDKTLCNGAACSISGGG